MGQRHPEESAQSPRAKAPSRQSSCSSSCPEHTEQRGMRTHHGQLQTHRPPSSTRTRQVLHSPQPATSGGVPQPQLAVICPILFEVSSLIAPVFTAPREEPLPKQTWGWWKEVSRSSGAPQQLDGSCPRSLLFSTPLWFLREAVQQCLLYLRHRHTPSIPKITVSLPQPQLSLQSRSRDTDTQGITGHVG